MNNKKMPQIVKSEEVKHVKQYVQRHREEKIALVKKLKARVLYASKDLSQGLIPKKGGNVDSARIVEYASRLTGVLNQCLRELALADASIAEAYSEFMRGLPIKK